MKVIFTGGILDIEAVFGQEDVSPVSETDENVGISQNRTMSTRGNRDPYSWKTVKKVNLDRFKSAGKRLKSEFRKMEDDIVNEMNMRSLNILMK